MGSKSAELKRREKKKRRHYRRSHRPDRHRAEPGGMNAVMDLKPTKEGRRKEGRTGLTGPEAESVEYRRGEKYRRESIHTQLPERWKGPLKFFNGRGLSKERRHRIRGVQEQRSPKENRGRGVLWVTIGEVGIHPAEIAAG